MLILGPDSHEEVDAQIRSSVLAVLFHGLEADVREKFADVGDFGSQRLIARDVKVRSDEDIAAGGLLRAERVY